MITSSEKLIPLINLINFLWFYTGIWTHTLLVRVMYVAQFKNNNSKIFLKLR